MLTELSLAIFCTSVHCLKSVRSAGKIQAELAAEQDVTSEHQKVERPRGPHTRKSQEKHGLLGNGLGYLCCGCLYRDQPCYAILLQGL